MCKNVMTEKKMKSKMETPVECSAAQLLKLLNVILKSIKVSRSPIHTLTHM